MQMSGARVIRRGVVFERLSPRFHLLRIKVGLCESDSPLRSVLEGFMYLDCEGIVFLNCAGYVSSHGSN